MKFLKNVKGAVFIITMFISMLMIVIALSASNMLLQDTRMIRHIKYATQAKYIAEAGVSDALVNLYNQSTTGWSAYGPTSATTLGEGKYSVTVNKTGSRWLVSATGTVNNVSQTVSAEVKNLYPEALHYSLVSSGDVDVRSNQGNVTIVGDFHAGGNMLLMAQGPATTLSVTGKATAVGSYSASTTGSNILTISDTANSGGGKDPISMPSFDFAAFMAAATVIPGNQNYNGATVGASTGGLTYVDGNVDFSGACTINGGFVARGYIKLTFAGGNSLTQNISATNPYPIFMSQDGNEIMLFGQFTAPTVPSIIYATNDIKIQTPGGSPTVLGTVIAGGTLTTTANAPLTLTYGKVTASAVVPSGIEIVSWNR
ncbi:MAG: pilus assembly PilX N-terminal domain-containing protein [Omnitrophica bacterium]|nr:pilus assembly PilX N-terminal domain-containing protein [Candidatus Omnitrophota bacterium]